MWLADKGRIIWLGKTWQFESNVKAMEAMRRMAKDGIAPQEYPEWEWLYPLCLKHDRQCLFPQFGACFHPGQERRTICYVAYRDYRYRQFPFLFLEEMRPILHNKRKLREKLGKRRVIRLGSGSRRTAQIQKLRVTNPDHIETTRIPLCCMEMARMVPRRLVKEGYLDIQLLPAVEDQKVLDYVAYLEGTLSCLQV